MRRAPRDRPEWWPEDRPWPPPEEERRGPSHRFLLRAFLAIALVLVTLAALVAAGGYLALVALGVLDASTTLRLGGVVVLVVAAGAFAMVVRGARTRVGTLGRLVEATAGIERGDYSQRVPERGMRETRALARSFNAMSERLERIDTDRRTFLADVAHELRTPLAVIRGRVEAMRDGVHPRDDDHLAAVLRQVDALGQVVADLGTVALADTGSLPIRREEVDLAVLVSAVLDDHADAALTAGVELTSDVAPEAATVEADPARLRQVLMNLLANALRHTPRGGSIVVATRSTADTVSIDVTDTGEGIAPDLLPRVLERFVRGEGSPGSGLGLAIVADIAAAHGGAVAVASAVGAGTTVTVTLARV
jgi:two-component system sensor histidine kinase BaeS